MHQFRQISVFEVAVFSTAVAVGLTIYQHDATSIETAIVTGIWIIVLCLSAARNWRILFFHILGSLVIYHSYFSGGFYNTEENAWHIPFAYLDVAALSLTLSSLIVVIQSCILFSKFRPYHLVLGITVLVPLLLGEFPIGFSVVIWAIVLVFIHCWPESPKPDPARNRLPTVISDGCPHASEHVDPH